MLEAHTTWCMGKVCELRMSEYLRNIDKDISIPIYEEHVVDKFNVGITSRCMCKVCEAVCVPVHSYKINYSDQIVKYQLMSNSVIFYI